MTKHKIWPVSYVNDEGQQINTTYTFDPSRLDKDYWVGEAVTVEVEHPDIVESLRAAKILKMRETLAKLESGK